MAGVFFTGFPGFLGRELLPRVLRRDPDSVATCLVQAKYRRDAEAAVRSLDEANPGLGRRVQLVNGDITAPDLGLGPAYTTLARATQAIFHLAAVYDLGVGRDLAMRVNVDGTRHVLDFAARATALRRLHYVSTCYVSGRYCGIFREDDLQKDQNFNNFYEETKHLAEVEVRARMPHLPATIYRPSIVVGDHRTGATQKLDGPYFIIQWLVRQGVLAVMPLVGDPTMVRFNVVPRDFVVDAIAHLSAREDNAGVTYQLADPAPPTALEMLQAIEAEVGQRVLHVPLPARLAKALLTHVPGVGNVLRIPPSAIDYFVHPAHYDTQHAARDLAGSGVRCPTFASYAPELVRFVRAHPEVSSAPMV